MWIRLRFDIRWRDLVAAAAYCFSFGTRRRNDAITVQAWSVNDTDRQHDCLITLSVRSSFDLLLRTLNLPPGSEILMSALTVPDMVSIVRAHGLVAVPVEIDHDGKLCLDSLRSSATERSKLLVVAHLFGGRFELDDVCQFAKSRDLMIVEDCAQSFQEVGDCGHPCSDIVMHSFGPIKTATALGGSVMRTASPCLRNRIAKTLSGDPVQTRLSYLLRIFRFAMLKMLSGKLTASIFFRLVTVCGYQVDSLVNSLGRGFDSSKLMSQIRRRPSTPLLRLMRHRWRTFDLERIERRRQLGRQMDQRLDGTGLTPARSSSDAYWVYPVFISNNHEMARRMFYADFDATTQSRMIVMEPANGERSATSLLARWQNVVFLPWYPELDERQVDEMVQVIKEQLQHQASAENLEPATTELLLESPARPRCD